MKALFRVIEIPPGFAQSYDKMRYGRYGMMRWRYSGAADSPVTFAGPFEWINSTEFVTKPVYDAPVAIDYWFATGVIATVRLSIKINWASTPGKIMGIFLNPANGDGLPLDGFDLP